MREVVLLSDAYYDGCQRELSELVQPMTSVATLNYNSTS